VDRGPCYTAPQPAGCTRDCLLPWHYTYVSANGDVKPCCVRPPIGTIHQGLSLDTILNSSQMIALRDGLLRGEPDGWCRGCPEAPWAPVAKLNTKVRAYLESGVLPNTYMTERQRYVDLHYDPLAMQRERDDIRADRDRLLAQIDADQREQARGMMSIRTLSRALMRAIAERLRLRVLTRRATS
jgi:hypothetical protein